MSAGLTAVLGIAALPALAGTGYLALLAVMARRLSAPPGDDRLRFTVIVPAHDESGGIARTVASLRALHYPTKRLRVLVVADNCTDDTAARARAAGAEVLERHDPDRRGKGFALTFGFDAVLADGWSDAVVVVDADTVVAANLLTAFGARLTAGSEAAQAEYGVRNAEESWRTRLLELAFTLHHALRSLGRERLRLSCGLRGNGMAFRTALLQRVPHRSTALVEDVEYGLELGMQGVRVAFVHDAWVRGDMPIDPAAARTQRDRWERGRQLLTRNWTGPLLRAVLAGRGRVPADLAADLLVPPLVTLTLWVAVGALVATGLALWRGAPLAAAPWWLSIAFLFVYVARGIALSPAGWRSAWALAWVPKYAIWKLTQRKARMNDTTWIRTARTAPPPGLRKETPEA